MYGRTNAGGGSISPFAFIFVTYPADSVCTCTDGSRTLKLKNTSGYGVFYPPYIGMWTVTIADPKGENKSMSKTYEVTKEGQVINAELNYGQYFYNRGNEYVGITGGWIKGTSSGALGSFTKNDASMDIVTGGSTVMIIGTSDAIDMTPYKTLTIVFDSAVVGTGVSKCVFGLSSNLNSDTPFAAQVSVSGLEATLDVSSINAAYKIALYNGINNNVKVQSIKGNYD